MEDKKIVNHFFHPLLFFGSQCLLVLPIIVSLDPIVRNSIWRWRDIKSEERFNSRFLTFFTFGPFLFTLIVSFLFGIRLATRYGSPFWFLMPLFFLFHFERDESKVGFRRSLAIYAGVFLIFFGWLVGDSLIYPSWDSSIAVNYPIKNLGEQTQKIWNQHFDTPCPLIGGEYCISVSAAITMKDRPRIHACYRYDFNKGKQTDLLLHSYEEMNRKGGILLWHDDGREEYLNGVPMQLHTLYPKAKVLQPILLQCPTLWGYDEKKIGIAIVPTSDADYSFD
jgi:hypothetical protein